MWQSRVKVSTVASLAELKWAQVFEKQQFDMLGFKWDTELVSGVKENTESKLQVSLANFSIISSLE